MPQPMYYMVIIGLGFFSFENFKSCDLAQWHLLRLEVSGANGLFSLYRVYFMLSLRTGSTFLQWRPCT